MLHALGRHLLIELTDCDPLRLDDLSHLERSMRAAAEAAGATIVQSTFHRFSPIGASGVVIIQESHLAIHTWPEHGYAAVDLFTCGQSLRPELALEVLRTAFGAGHSSCIEVQRGHRELLTQNSLRAPSPPPPA
jgi:spermidine synthase